MTWSTCNVPVPRLHHAAVCRHGQLFQTINRLMGTPAFVTLEREQRYIAPASRIFSNTALAPNSSGMISGSSSPGA